MTTALVSDSPVQPISSLVYSLQQRAAALHRKEIDFVPNASFDFSEQCTSAALAAKVATGNFASDGLPGDLPAHLGRLCETQLLTREEESNLFRQMNYYKFLASELRMRLDPVEPDPQSLEAMELLLGQAQEIRDHIIKANLRLVMSIVKKFVTPLSSFDELLSEGTITLMHAVEKFDFDRGFRFSTYAYRSISRTAYRLVASVREEESRVTRDADEWAFGQCDDQPSSSMSDQFWNRLRGFTADMLQRLDRRERFIVRSRFALGSHRRVRSLQDLANRLGVSKERVRQIEARAIEKLQAMAKELDLESVRLSIN
ncbi:MAG: sigma-70 family RNA polymerase sigma factor [Pirellulaceae bacterium]|nr:sigma-70 family RNA polymerase sigma factor [Pirellulaceae bacterium]